MTVLVDLDNVLINTGEVWVGELNRRHGLSVNYYDTDDYYMPQFFPSLTEREVYEPLSDGSVFRKVQPIDGAGEVLEWLLAHEHDVYIVTASSPNTVDMKWRDIIQKYYPMITNDHVVVAHKKQMLMADVLVDDAPFNLDGGYYYKILFDAPHNRHCKKYDRAFNWNAVLNFIRMYYDNKSHFCKQCGIDFK